jgi:hypothetical protein
LARRKVLGHNHTIMKVVLEIDDSKSEAFLDFLRLLDFVQIAPEPRGTDQSDWPDIE